MTFMMTMNRKTNDKVFIMIVTIALWALAYVLTTLCLPTPFYTNDEVLMRSIANGTYTGTNDGHLIYIMYCLGIIFAGLYKLIPSVNWYDLFMLSLHYLCWAMIVGKVGSFIKSRLYKTILMFFSMCLIVTVDCKFVFFHQYTILAGVVFATGVIFLWDFFENAKKKDAVVSVLFFTISLWIRKQVFLMGIPFVLLVLFVWFICYVKTKGKGMMARLLRFFAFVGGFAVLSFAVEKIAYSSDEWKSFLEYNSARTDLVDFYGMPAYEDAEDILEKYGISQEEYIPLNQVNLSFSDKYSVELLKELAARASENYSGRGNTDFYRAVLLQVFLEWKFAVKQPIGLLILLFGAVNLVLGIRQKKYVFSLAAFGAIAYQCAFTAYFVYRSRYPERISFTFYFMHLIFQAGMLLCLQKNVILWDKLKEKKALVNGTAVAGALFGLLLLFTCGKKNVLTAHSENAEWEPYRNEVNVLCDYCEEHSDERFVVSVPVACFLCDEMGLSVREYPSNALSMCYWTCGSPLYEKNSENAGISVPCKELLEEGVFFVFRDEYNTDWVNTYYSYVGKNIEISIVDVLSTEEGLLNIARVVEK